MKFQLWAKSVQSCTRIFWRWYKMEIFGVLLAHHPSYNINVPGSLKKLQGLRLLCGPTSQILANYSVYICKRSNRGDLIQRIVKPGSAFYAFVQIPELSYEWMILFAMTNGCGLGTGNRILLQPLPHLGLHPKQCNNFERYGIVTKMWALCILNMSSTLEVSASCS